MSAAQIATLSPGGDGVSTTESSAAETAVLLDTGSISGNLLVLAASLAKGQQQSTSQLSEMGGHIQEMRGHMQSLAESSKQFNTALGLDPSDPAKPPTLTIHDQSIDRLANRLFEKLRPPPRDDDRFAALHQRLEHLSDRLDRMQARQTGREPVGGAAGMVTLEQMNELHGVVEQLRVQVGLLLADRPPGGPGGGSRAQAAAPPRRRS